MHAGSRQYLGLGYLFGTCLVLAACSQTTSDDERPDFPWRFVKVADLDTGNDEALLGDLQFDAAAIRPDGTVFVATDSWTGLHEFDRTGKWIQNLGREGHGPGEFQRVRYVSSSPSGRLLIYDDIQDRGRVSVLERSGEFLTSFRYSIDAPIEARIESAGDTRCWTMTSPPSRGIPPVRRRQDLILLSVRGDTLHICPIPDSEPEMVIELDGTPVSSVNPAVGAPRWTVSPDGMVWQLTPGAEHLVRISSETGESDTLAVRASAPIFTDQQWAQVLEAQTAVMHLVEFLEPYIEPTERALEEMRDSLSPVQRMWWIDEGGILVDRMPAPSPSSQKGPWRYSALLQDGRMTKEVEGPPGILTAAYGYALQVTSVWLELPTLTLWKLEPDAD